ncbi:MAG: hypothetical protein WA125_03430 [Desulfosporosinus sp.]
MNKRFFFLLLTAVMLCGMMPATAFAADETSGQTTITYTVSANYEINIPASINLNEDPYLKITASNMNTNYGQRVSVLIDGSRTYENGGNFYLYKNKGTASEAKIACNLRAPMSIVNGLDYEVARFDDGSTSNPVDPLMLEPAAGSSTAPGTYTGTIYFKITMT